MRAGRRIHRGQCRRRRGRDRSRRPARWSPGGSVTTSIPSPTAGAGLRCPAGGSVPTVGTARCRATGGPRPRHLGVGARVRRHDRPPPLASARPGPATPPRARVASETTRYQWPSSSGWPLGPTTSMASAATAASTLDRWAVVAASSTTPPHQVPGPHRGAADHDEEEGQTEGAHHLVPAHRRQQPYHGDHRQGGHQVLGDGHHRRAGHRKAQGMEHREDQHTQGHRRGGEHPQFRGYAEGGRARARSSRSRPAGSPPRTLQPVPPTASAATRQRRGPVTDPMASTARKTTAAAAGSLTVAARAQRTRPGRSRPVTPSVTPATRRPDHQRVVVARGHEAEQGQRAERAPSHSADPRVGAQVSGQPGE